MNNLIFNEDFEVKEVADRFADWLQNEHDKRLTKKGNKA